MSSEEQRRKAERLRNLYIARKAQEKTKSATIPVREVGGTSGSSVVKPTGRRIFAGAAGTVERRTFSKFRYYAVVILVLFGIFIGIANIIAWLAHLAGIP